MNFNHSIVNFQAPSRAVRTAARVAVTALTLVAAGQAAATTYYGKLVGTITSYAPQTYNPNDPDFNTWFMGEYRNPIGTTFEFNFTVSDLYSANGNPPTPLVNNSSDPAHYGTYTTSIGTSSYFGNASPSSITLDGRTILRSKGTYTQSLINDLAPGDKYSWSTSLYPDYSVQFMSDLSFSVQTLQNILSSGYAAQEFYWLRSNDPAGIASGQFKMDAVSMKASYGFDINRLSLTLSQNPAPPAVPVPAAGWLLGSALLGLGGLARRRK